MGGPNEMVIAHNFEVVLWIEGSRYLVEKMKMHKCSNKKGEAEHKN